MKKFLSFILISILIYAVSVTVFADAAPYYTNPEIPPITPQEIEALIENIEFPDVPRGTMEDKYKEYNDEIELPPVPLGGVSDYAQTGDSGHDLTGSVVIASMSLFSAFIIGFVIFKNKKAN